MTKTPILFAAGLMAALTLSACGSASDDAAPTVPAPPPSETQVEAPTPPEPPVVEVETNDAETVQADNHDESYEGDEHTDGKAHDHKDDDHKHDDNHEDHAEHDHGHDNHDQSDGVGEAHVHGASEMVVVIDGSVLSVSFSGPLYNVVGFEHAPKTPEQEQAMDDLRGKMKMIGTLVKIPPNAGCRGVDYELSIENSGTHGSLIADYTTTCSGLSNIDELDVTAFEVFNGLLETIDAIAITPAGQTALTLTAASNTLTLPK